MGTEYYHTLIEKGGKVLGYGNVITENDWQIMGNENNRAICPPEENGSGTKQPRSLTLRLYGCHLTRFRRHLSPKPDLFTKQPHGHCLDWEKPGRSAQPVAASRRNPFDSSSPS